MKYVTQTSDDHNAELRSWYFDSCGNRLDKETHEFVVLVPNKKDNLKWKPISLINREGEWVETQLEINFE